MFLEWAQVHGYYYGTSRSYLEDQLLKNNIVVSEVDVQGASSIKEAVSAGKIKTSAVFIFLIPPSVDILAFRLRRRKTENAEIVNYRLRAAIAELQVMEKYDYIVVNDKVDTASEKIKAIMTKELGIRGSVMKKGFNKLRKIKSFGELKELVKTGINYLKK